MDNRGFDRDKGAYGYSYRPPPPQVYTLDSGYERERYRKPRAYTSSESSYSDRRHSVGNPPDGGVWAWLIVLACTVLHLCAELVYYVFYDTIMIAHFRNAHQNIPQPTPTYTEFMVFEDASYLGAFVAAVIAVYLGYRVVAVLGGISVFVGFLTASFLKPDDDIEWFGFLVGFLGGIGVSFFRFTAYVAVMEYFVRYRMIAILLSGLGRALGAFIGYGILVVPLQTVRDPDNTKDDLEAMQNWDIWYKCQVVMAVIGALAGLFIKPLSLAGDYRYQGCEWAMRIRDSRLCRGGMLFLVLVMYFIYYLGQTLPMYHLIARMSIENVMTQRWSTTHVIGALFTFACGMTLGYILLAFWPRKKRLYGSLIWMGLFALAMGLVTLTLPAIVTPYLSYVASFVGIIGVCQVLFESVLRYVIPIAFGRYYIRWVEGLLGLMAGSATISSNFIAERLTDLDEQYKELTNLYYFAGSAFLAAGLLLIVVVNILDCLKVRDVNYERNEREVLMSVQDETPMKEVARRATRSEPMRSSRRYEEPTTHDYYGYQYR